MELLNAIFRWLAFSAFQNGSGVPAQRTPHALLFQTPNEKSIAPIVLSPATIKFSVQQRKNLSDAKAAQFS
jgi:hypothetical protein